MSDLATLDDLHRTRRERLLKVPELTVWFWVAKLLTTALGEATSDYLVGRYDPVLVVIGGFVAVCAALAWQLTRRSYHAVPYWSAALMVSVFGTMAADVVHVQFGVPYAVSAAGCVVALALVFGVWWRTEGTLSIHSVDSLPRELFYWAAATATFAMGTATGDLTAVTLHLGYLSSGLLFGAVFLVPAVLWAATRRHGILLFWFAYIVTRPFGASFADWGGKPTSARGLGYGDGAVALVLAVLLVATVAGLALTRVDDPAEVEVAHAAAA